MAYANEQRLLDQKRYEEILKNILPLPQDSALNEFMYKAGLTKQKAKEFLSMFFKKTPPLIKKDKEGNLIWNKQI